ncbi:MAG TPA: GNAT family N-acetyltransferase [Pyrinomonadaceae bacterium]|jgi:GNAT superfamily N-acetyltransferase
MTIDAEISEFEERDFQPLAEFFREALAATYPFLDEKFLQLPRFENILREHTLPQAKVSLAKINGEIIGFAAIGRNFIDQLYVHPDYQGKGLGSFWIEQAKTKYSDFLELYTFAANAKAIAFYKKHGFKIIERGVAPDEKVPDVKMLWRGHF